MALIKNIIFDFGGVIYNIDFSKAKKAFAKIGVHHFDQLYSQAIQNHLFEKLEMDLISPHEFRDEIRKLAELELSDEKIDAAWNSLLIGFDERRLELLNELKRNYRIFLFSNTNRIHYSFFLKQFQALTNYKSFDGLFVKSFFSFDIKKRKPDLDSYQHLISTMQIDPSETLFVDDSVQNLKPAAKLGIKCWHLTEDVLDLFDDAEIKQSVLDQLD